MLSGYNIGIPIQLHKCKLSMETSSGDQSVVLVKLPQLLPQLGHQLAIQLLRLLAGNSA